MKVITIWQPWASLIDIGAKPYEFRAWVPPAALIGQRIGIHAGARPMRKSEIAALIGQLIDPDRFGQPCLRKEKALPFLERVYDQLSGGADPLPRSHILCTGVLCQPKRGDECAADFGPQGRNDSDRQDTFNWGWPLTDVEHLEPPMPMRGAQGFWNWSGMS